MSIPFSNGIPPGGPQVQSNPPSVVQIANQAGSLSLPGSTVTQLFSKSVAVPAGSTGIVRVDVSLEVQSVTSPANIALEYFLDGVQDTTNGPFGSEALPSPSTGLANLYAHWYTFTGVSAGSHTFAVKASLGTNGATVFQGQAVIQVY